MFVPRSASPFEESAAAADLDAAQGAVAVEMEAATVFAVAQRRGVRAACVLGVTDVSQANGALRAGPQRIEEIGLRVGEAGYSSLRIR